jgi:excisionase family DNA binding protein
MALPACAQRPADTDRGVLQSPLGLLLFMDQNQEYFTLAEVAQKVGMSYWAVYRDQQAGKLKAVFKKRRWRVHQSWIDEWMEGSPSALQAVFVREKQVA